MADPSVRFSFECDGITAACGIALFSCNRACPRGLRQAQPTEAYTVNILVSVDRNARSKHSLVRSGRRKRTPFLRNGSPSPLRSTEYRNRTTCEISKR